VARSLRVHHRLVISFLKFVREQFLLVRERVACLFPSDPILRELCQDYQVRALEFDRLAGSDTVRSEYAALRLRLETELLRYLHEADERSGRGK